MGMGGGGICAGHDSRLYQADCGPACSTSPWIAWLSQRATAGPSRPRFAALGPTPSGSALAPPARRAAPRKCWGCWAISPPSSRTACTPNRCCGSSCSCCAQILGVNRAAVFLRHPPRVLHEVNPEAARRLRAALRHRPAAGPAGPVRPLSRRRHRGLPLPARPHLAPRGARGAGGRGDAEGVRAAGRPGGRAHPGP